MSERRTIHVDYLARVEGESSLHLVIEQGRLTDVQLRIFEPPRFFEALLVGRDLREAPDITARICGICPVAYLMSACNAMEQVADVRLDPEIIALRRLLYCGEWIESHVLHVAMLHAPDFLGYPDAMTMARDHPELVRTALRLKKAGNAIVRLLGGREIHPVNVRVGGFYRAPRRDELLRLRDELVWGLEAAEWMTAQVASLPFEQFEPDYTFFSLRHPDEYPFNEGRLATSTGREGDVADYEAWFEERHDAHSTALRTYPVDGGLVHLGPLARYAINAPALGPRATTAARAAGLNGACRNPFRSIVVRMVEVVFAFEEALRIIDGYRPPARPAVDVTPRAHTGYGATEAPRGTLYHRYRVSGDGTIEEAKIVAPTSVNQRVIERDLAWYVRDRLDRPDEELQMRCEQAIRNYDPCISCSTHFLRLDVERR